jgi:alcohol dehydrogenase (quinone), cytochrome c subunit
MRRAGATIGWSILVAAVILAALLVVVILHPTHIGVESPPMKAGSSDVLIERGKYLAAAGNCASCHSRPEGAPFAGGVPFATPFGTIYSTNITPDSDTGIGKWTVEDLRRAMHEGIARGGVYLFPAFPYPSFTKVSDEDVEAIYAYLRSLAPHRQSAPANGILLRQRWAMRIWNWLFFRPGRYVPEPTRSDEWNRGAYLVEGLGHCGACHTPRNVFMAEITSQKYSGGLLQDNVAMNRLRRWSCINLTSAKEGLAAWSLNDLSTYLKAGFAARAGTFGPMNEVIVSSLSRLTSEDVRAMAVYLKGLPPHEHADGEITAKQIGTGEEIYRSRCEKCHLKSGRGGLFNGPPLQGSAIVQARDAASLINITLYGPDTPKDISFGAWESMQPYLEILDDSEVAAVVNYVRASWGNRGGPVSASDVAKQR